MLGTYFMFDATYGKAHVDACTPPVPNPPQSLTQKYRFLFPLANPPRKLNDNVPTASVPDPVNPVDPAP